MDDDPLNPLTRGKRLGQVRQTTCCPLIATRVPLLADRLSRFEILDAESVQSLVEVVVRLPCHVLERAPGHVVELFPRGPLFAWTSPLEANRHDALTERQRVEQGFVQGSFGEAALRAMAGAGNVLVAEDAGGLAGLVCLAAPGDVPDPPPPVAVLLAAQDRPTWEGRPPSDTRRLLYGPVVVGAGHRGKGVARGPYEAALRAAAPRAEAVVAFIERANEASRKVHVDGFGMAVLGGYEVHGPAYDVVAAAARPSA